MYHNGIFKAWWNMSIVSHFQPQPFLMAGVKSQVRVFRTLQLLMSKKSCVNWDRWYVLEFDVEWRWRFNIRIFEPMLVLIFIFHDLKTEVMFEAEVMVDTDAGHEIVPNTGANATKFFSLATKSWKLVAKLATRMFHHNLTKRSSELKRFAKTNPRQTSSLSLFPKCSTCISIDN